jgi:hypothetical protein
MMLRDSGDPDATDLAIEKFEIALAETPNDAVATHALASMLERKGSHRKVISLLEPLARSGSDRTKVMALRTLISAYRGVSETLKELEAKRDLEALLEGGSAKPRGDRR